MLGGLFEKTDTRSLNGWPGLAKIPLMRYFFSDDKIDHQENEVLIVMTPRIVRIPEWTKGNLRPLYSGSESNVQVRRDRDVRTPTAEPTPGVQQPVTPNQTPGTAGGVPNWGAAAVPGGGQGTQGAIIRFEPKGVSLKGGTNNYCGHRGRQR